MTRFRPFLSLRVRLILLVLLALIPALAIMLYTAAETRQRETERVENEALTLVRLLSANQESIIEGARQLLIAVTQIRDVQSGDPAACSARLVELLKVYPDYNGFGVARPDDEVFCSTVPLTQPINASNRAWFQRAIQTRNFAVGDYQVGRTSGRAILVFSYPLLDAAGQLQAVVFAVIELVNIGVPRFEGDNFTAVGGRIFKGGYEK